ncbi:SURF1 family protein [Pseudoxanthomonas wuyuanensis]
MSRRMPLALGWGLALLAMAAFCVLGSWQLGRAKQKEAMLTAAQQVLARRDSPLPLSAAADDSQAADYGWASGPGRFVSAPAVLLDNQTRDGRVGVRAYRAFQPAAGAMPLLVDLGWLPLPANRQLPAVPQPTATQTLRGLLSPPPSPGLVSAQAARQADGTLLVAALDLRQLAPALRLDALAPRVLKLDPDLPLGYARDLDILPNTLPPQRHLGYAVQWFGLALAVLATALVLTLRARKGKGAPSGRP